jgi:hypothetical protein
MKTGGESGDPDMIANVQAVSYFYATVANRPDDACRLLSRLAEAGVNLLAFAAIPLGPEHTQLVLFPDNPQQLTEIADPVGFALTGPQRAFLVQGDDRLGAIADIYGKLSEVGVSVYASSGVTDGRGGFGYILYVRAESFERAEEALKGL